MAALPKAVCQPPQLHNDVRHVVDRVDALLRGTGMRLPPMRHDLDVHIPLVRGDRQELGRLGDDGEVSNHAFLDEPARSLLTSLLIHDRGQGYAAPRFHSAFFDRFHRGDQRGHGAFHIG